MKRATKKRQTKDPIKQDPLPQAGDSTYQQLQELLDGPAYFWIFVSATLVACTVARWIEYWQKQILHPRLWTSATIVVIAIAVFKIRSVLGQVKNLRLGIRGEMAVGQFLEQTRAMGYRVYHDIEEKGFNIDHVLVGPGGVFVIETKTRSKSIQGNPVIIYDGERVLVDGHAPDRDPIAQAKACRDHIKWIFSKVTQRDPKLRAVVLFPGWFIERKAKNVEVWVLNPPAFVKFLKHESSLLTSEEVGMFSEALEIHIRSNRRS